MYPPSVGKQRCSPNHFPLPYFLVGRRMITREGSKDRYFPISFFQTPGICGTLECLMGEMVAILITLLHSHYIKNHNSHPQAAVSELSPPFQWFIYYTIIAKTDAQHLQMWNPLFVQIIPPKSYLPLPPDHRKKEEFAYWRKSSYQAAQFIRTHTQPQKRNFVHR